MSTLQEVAATLGLASKSTLNTETVENENSVNDVEQDVVMEKSPKRGRGRPPKSAKKKQDRNTTCFKKIKIESEAQHDDSAIALEGDHDDMTNAQKSTPGRPAKSEPKSRVEKAAFMLECAEHSIKEEIDSSGDLSRKSTRLKDKPLRKYTHYGIQKVKKHNLTSQKKSIRPSVFGRRDFHSHSDAEEQKVLPLKKRKLFKQGKLCFEGNEMEPVESLTTKDGKSLADNMFTESAKIFMITIKNKKKQESAKLLKKQKLIEEKERKALAKAHSTTEKKKKKVRTVALLPKKTGPQIVSTQLGLDSMTETDKQDNGEVDTVDSEQIIQGEKGSNPQKAKRKSKSARPKISLKLQSDKNEKSKKVKNASNRVGRPRKGEFNINDEDIDYDLLNKHSQQIEAEVKGQTKMLRKCNFCMTYKTQQDVNIFGHIQLHIQGELSCVECNYHTNNRTNIKAHIARYHTGQADFMCSICPKQFYSKRDLDAHEATVHHTQKHKHPCPHCDSHWPTSKKLKEHILKTHKGEGLYRCEECHRGFIFKAWYERHFQWCGHRHSKCPYCDQVLVDPHARNLHIRRIHQREKNKNCRFCEFKAFSRTEIINHERRHTRIFPYKCTECTFAAAKKSQLTSHMRRHTGERPFCCSSCPFTSAWSVQLKSHMRLHSNPSSMVCNQCGILCANHRQLVIHKGSNCQEAEGVETQKKVKIKYGMKSVVLEDEEELNLATQTLVKRRGPQQIRVSNWTATEGGNEDIDDEMGNISDGSRSTDVNSYQQENENTYVEQSVPRIVNAVSLTNDIPSENPVPQNMIAVPDALEMVENILPDQRTEQVYETIAEDGAIETMVSVSDNSEQYVTLQSDVNTEQDEQIPEGQEEVVVMTDAELTQQTIDYIVSMMQPTLQPGQIIKLVQNTNP